MKELILSILVFIRSVESSGGADPRAGGNDLQITPICVRDVNRIYGTKYTMRDVTDRRKSEEIAVLYLSHWVPKKTKKPNGEAIARIWHRGPSKWMDDKGATYWEKVKKKMKGIYR